MKILLLQVTRNALSLTPANKNGNKVSFDVPHNFELPETLRQGEVYSNISLFSKFVRSCVDKTGFKTKKIMFCLEDANVISKEFQYLPCSRKNLLSFAKLEADSVLSDNVDDYIIQNYEYGLKNKVTGKMTGLLFAVKRNLILEIRKNFFKYGLRVIKIVPPAGGLLYAAKNAVDTQNKTVAVLDLSLEKTRLLVLHDGFPVFQRTFESIYDDIIEILMKSGSASYEESAALFKTCGVSFSPNIPAEASAQISALLDASVNEAIRNIRMVLSSERLELNKIVLCGEMSTLPNYSDFWNQLGLDVPLESIDPCANAGSLPLVGESASQAGYPASAFFSVFGLLTVKKPDDIDFLQSIKEQANARAANAAVLAFITLIALGIMLVEPLYYINKLSQNAADKISLLKYTEIVQLLDSQSNLSSKIANIKSDHDKLPYGKSKAGDAAKQLLGHIVPKVSSLETFNVDNDTGSIAITFKVPSYSDYLTVKSVIESSSYFTISIPFTVTSDDKGVCTCSAALGWKDYVPSGYGSKDGVKNEG